MLISFHKQQAKKWTGRIERVLTISSPKKLRSYLHQQQEQNNGGEVQLLVYYMFEPPYFFLPERAQV